MKKLSLTHSRSSSFREPSICQTVMTNTHNDVCVTVLTPTYNRRHTLSRLYKSLLDQTFSNFEWLIIDDGSTDDTKGLIEQWQAECLMFPIKYHWKPNGGKHTAHNQGITLAQGTYCAIIDSDDWYNPRALENLLRQWDSMTPEIRCSFANIEGLCCLDDGSLIGSRFPQDVLDSNNFEIRISRAKPGDTMGMYRTNVLREFPFPEVCNIRFVTEGIVWNRVAEKYRSRFINSVIGYKEYLPDGLSQQDLRSRVANAASSLLYHTELLKLKFRVPFTMLIRSGANYTRLSLHQGIGTYRQFRDASRKLLFFIAFPLGLFLYLNDRRRAWTEKK